MKRIKTALYILFLVLLIPFILIFGPIIAALKGYEEEDEHETE